MSEDLEDIDETGPEDNEGVDGSDSGSKVSPSAETIEADDTVSDFDDPIRGEPITDPEALVVNLDGYEGPLDVLLELARNQKVDIRKISMMALVEQYLIFIEIARQQNLELAADYLVMASWLAYLKSKMLLPKLEENGEEPTADEMAARLAFQLQRLEAMRKATDDLFKRPRLGLEVFTRGSPEGVRVTRTPEWHADLFDLLKAYTSQRVQTVDRNYLIEKPKVFSLEDARARLARILGMIPEWSELRALSPLQDIDAPERSVLASAFHAALEFAKEGKMDLRQMGHFEPIYVRNRDDADSGNFGGGGQEGEGRVHELTKPDLEGKNEGNDLQAPSNGQPIPDDLTSHNDVYSERVV